MLVVFDKLGKLLLGSDEKITYLHIYYSYLAMRSMPDCSVVSIEVRMWDKN